MGNPSRLRRTTPTLPIPIPPHHTTARMNDLDSTGCKFRRGMEGVDSLGHYLACPPLAERSATCVPTAVSWGLGRELTAADVHGGAALLYHWARACWRAGAAELQSGREWIADRRAPRSACRRLH